MPGMFDDLVPKAPTQPKKAARGGMFDDLVPAPPANSNPRVPIGEAAPLEVKPSFAGVQAGFGTTETAPEPTLLGALLDLPGPALTRALYHGLQRADLPGAFRRGATATLASGTHLVTDAIDQVAQKPMRDYTEALGVRDDRGINPFADPLGAQAQAAEALAVNQAVAADSAAAAQAIGGRPSLGQLLADPVAAAEQLTAHVGSQAAQSAPSMALALATRNPEVGATLLGGTTGAQTYTDLRGQGVDRPTAAVAGAGTGLVEAGGEALGLPFVLGKGGPGALLQAIIAEGAQEAPVSIAQTQITDAATGTQTPLLQQLSDAFDAALVGGTIGGAGHVASTGPGVVLDALTRKPAAPAPRVEPVLGPLAGVGAPLPTAAADQPLPPLGPVPADAPTDDDLAALLAGAGLNPEQVGNAFADLIPQTAGPAPADPAQAPAAGSAPPPPGAALNVSRGTPEGAPDAPPLAQPADRRDSRRPAAADPAVPAAGASAPALDPESALGDAYLAPEGRPPERPPLKADRAQVAAMRAEVGWLQKGGRLVRAAADEATLNEDERNGTVPVPKGAVVGRTTWQAPPSPDGGESQFWRNRPVDGWKPEAFNAALDAFEAGKPLTRQQRRMVAYAQQAADTYAQVEAEQRQELEAFDEVTRQREFQGLREDIDQALDQASRDEALSHYQLLTRAVKEGGYAIDDPVLDQPPGESDRAYAVRLHQLIRSPRRAPDSRATPSDPAAGGQGRGQRPDSAGLGDLLGDAPGAAQQPAAAAREPERAAPPARAADQEVNPRFEPTQRETWEDGTVVEFGKTPFQPLAAGERKPLTNAQDLRDAVERDVPLADLIASQDRITRNGLDKPRDDSQGLPIVVQQGGRLYIQDGHHRLAAQRFAGDTTARVRFIDKDAAPRPSAGLFGAPTARDVVDSAKRAKDAQRDGKTGTGRTDMASGAGELFAGRRPQQDGLESVESPIDVSPTTGSREVKVGDTTIIYGIGKDGTGEVISLRTPQSKRGHGSARAAMQQFLRATDAAGLRLKLGASPLDSRTRLGPLVAFYRSLGFEPTGKTINQAGEPEMVREPRAPLESAETPFYSAALRAIEQGKGAPKKADATAWSQWLDGAVRRGDMKQAERDWLGIDAWLAQQGPVTRDQLADFVRAHQVQVQDVVLGGDGAGRLPSGWYAERVPTGDWHVYDDEGEVRGEGATREEAVRDAQDEEALRDGESEQYGVPKFASYQLPGGANYRELLLTLPPKRGAAEVPEVVPHPAQQGRWALRFRDGSYVADDTAQGNETRRTTDPERAADWRERDLAQDYGVPAHSRAEIQSDTFRSSHFDQPNILAHVRFNERTDADGQKVLFLEEIQSDWHQAGRKQGYQSGKDERRTATTATRQDGYWEVRDQRGNFLANAMFNEVGTDEAAAIAAVQARVDGLQGEQVGRLARDGAVPDAPFKATDEWALLAFKRMVRWAAENGFDRIAWTTGAQQAERYDLSKRIGMLTAAKLHDGDWAISASGPRGGDIPGLRNKRVKESELEGMVGKELAEKIIKGEGGQPVRGGGRMYTGLDLKVGGEGMKAFYDRILPQAVNRWAKRFGGKVGRTSLPEFGRSKSANAMNDMELLGALNEPQGGYPAHSLDLTDAMRDAALGGQPLFNREDVGLGADLVQADTAAIKAAVDAHLGPVAAQVKYLRSWRELPERLRKGVESRLAQRGGVGQTAALFDPETQDVYLFTDTVPNPARAVWHVAHEIAGHQGLRALLGPKLDSLLDLALQNPTVREVADAIARERNIDQRTQRGRMLAAEEALAELAAATRTGDWSQIERRYKVEVPEGMRAKVTAALRTFLAKLKVLFDRVFDNPRFTDTDVAELLEHAWQAAQGNVVGDASEALESTGRKPAAATAFTRNSKVKHVVYHATAADFDTFDTSKSDLGAHFGSKEQAEHIAERRITPFGQREARILPVYLNLENPLRLKDVGSFHADAIADQLARKGIISKADAKRITAEDWRARKVNNAFVREAIKAAGYDGVVYKNTQERNEDNWIAFEPNQIKSADRNRGTFDPASPSILENLERFETAADVLKAGRLLSVVDAAKAKGLDLGPLQKAHAANSAREFTAALDGLLEKLNAPAKPAKPAQPTTGLANAITDAERREAGRDPILRDAVVSNEATVVAGMRALREDPEAGDEAIARITRGGDVSSTDSGVLLVYKTQLMNARNAAADVLGDPNASEDRKAVAQKRYDETEAKIAALDLAASALGSEGGRLLQFRRRQMAADFTLEAMESKERARLKRPLTVEESAKIKAMAATIADLQKKLDALQARIANAASESALADVVAEVQSPRLTAARESLRQAANDARARLRKGNLGQSNIGVDPRLFADLVLVGADHVANGIDKFGAWVDAMRADLGASFDRFRAEHPNLFKAAQRELAKPDRPVRAPKAAKTPDEVRAGMDPANVTPKDVRALVKAHVQAGLRGEPTVMQQVADDLGLPLDEVRALFVASSPKAPRTLDEVQAELRDLRKLVRIENEIARLEAGQPKAPKRPGEPDSPAVAAKKAELAALRESLKPPRDPEGRYQALRGAQIRARIADLQTRIARGDFAARPRIPRALNAANQAAQFELDQAKLAFADHQFRAALKNRTPLQKIVGAGVDASNLARALATSFDLFGLLRQGAISTARATGSLALGNPRPVADVGRAMATAIRAALSKQGESAVEQDLMARPNAPLYRRAGLAILGHGGGPLSQVEEAYAARWIETLPNGWKGALLGGALGGIAGGPVGAGIGAAVGLRGGGLVRGSARGYTALLNRLRADAFDALHALYSEERPLPLEQAKALADAVNTVTGRGKIPGKTDNAGAILNATIFSPRLLASRIKYLLAPLTAMHAYGGDARTRKLIATELYVKPLIGATILYTLASMALGDDDDDEAPLLTWDPRSSDFGKIRLGNTRIDPLAGLAQVATLAARLGAGETVTEKGAVKPLRPAYTWTDLVRQFDPSVPAHKLGKDGELPAFSRDSAAVLGQFARTKFAPVTSALVNGLAGSDLIGNPVSPRQALASAYSPLSWDGEQLAAITEEGGLDRLAGTQLAGLLGMGIQHRQKTGAEKLSDLTSAVDAVKADVQDRLAQVPVDQWETELAKMKAAHGALMDGVALDYYKADGKYGKEGEPKRTKDGKPVLVSEREARRDRYEAAIDEADDEAVHHLIPDHLVRHHPLMAQARKLGYDLDRASNLIALPKEPTPGRKLAHKGSHPDYDAQVMDALEAAQRRLKREHGTLDKAPKAEVLDAVDKIERALRQKIEARDVPQDKGRLSRLTPGPDRRA